MSWSEAWAEMSIYGLGDWGSWASIAGLVVTVYVSWKIVQVVRAIERDRLFTERIQNPIEIYFHVQQALKFLERLRSKGELAKRENGELTRIVRGLQKSADHLEHYFDFVSDLRQNGENPFLAAGRHHRAHGDAARAAVYFERALEHSKVYRRMSRSELSECVSELRVCYLATYNDDGIFRLERQAEALKIPFQAPEPGFAFLTRCIRERLTMHLRTVMYPFIRRRRPGTKIVQIHKPSL